MDNTPEMVVGDTREALAEVLAKDTAAYLQQGIDTNGVATMVVSGGSTPVPFFQALRQCPLPWNKVTVLVADERWVSLGSDDSNEKLVRDHLHIEGMNILSLAPEAGESLDTGVIRLEEQLKALPKTLDVVILGMGEDGHTASLFPHHPQLKAGLELPGEVDCLPIENSPKPPPQRVTLTAKHLLACRNLILHITGDAKRAVYEQALACDNPHDLPISFFLKQPQIPVTTYWAA